MNKTNIEKLINDINEKERQRREEEKMRENDKIAVSMRLKKSIIEKVDGVADEMGLTRTAAISCILSMYFNSQESIKVLDNISNLIRKEENIENV